MLALPNMHRVAVTPPATIGILALEPRTTGGQLAALHVLYTARPLCKHTERPLLRAPVGPVGRDLIHPHRPATLARNRAGEPHSEVNTVLQQGGPLRARLLNQLIHRQLRLDGGAELMPTQCPILSDD